MVHSGNNYKTEYFIAGPRKDDDERVSAKNPKLINTKIQDFFFQEYAVLKVHSHYTLSCKPYLCTSTCTTAI